MSPDQLLPNETNLLYVLLDAVEAAGALTPEQRARWMEYQVHFNTENARQHGPELYALLAEVCGEGSHAEPWIKRRWSGLRAQVEARLSTVEPAVIRRRRRSSDTGR
jgi:hypothetical protein